VGSLIWFAALFGVVAGGTLVHDGIVLGRRPEPLDPSGMPIAKIDDGRSFRPRGFQDPRFRISIGVLLVGLGIACWFLGVDHGWWYQRFVYP
jgi:hypothetical protein